MFNFRRNKKNEINFPQSINIRSPWETIEACKKIITAGVSGAYLRFGDGDVNLLEGQRELLQEANPRLKLEMEEAFSLDGPGIIKGLMIHSQRFGLWDGMRPGVHEASNEWAENLLRRCFPYFIGTQIYSHAALAYLAVSDQSFTIQFLHFLKAQRPIFIGNEKIPTTVIMQLFDTESHIKTPAVNSYETIDSVERMAVAAIRDNCKSFNVVVVAMGCSGRVLAKRLLKDNKCNVFVFDFGSLMDAFCGWSTRAWIEITGVSAGYFNDILSELDVDQHSDKSNILS
jgi:hypothetical protein